MAFLHRDDARLDGFRCAVCSGPPRGVVYRDGEWAVIACATCGLKSTWPRPSEEELEALYASAGYFDDRAMAADASAAARERAREVIGRVGGRQPLLDYGAGTGHLVQGARALGYAAVGFEPSRPARELARELYGLELLEALPTESFPAISLIHVVEHMRDPVEELRAVTRMLAPDGRVFIEVPHAGGVWSLSPAHRRLVYDLPAHLFHFTPETLTAVLSLAGLRVESVRTFNPWILERVLQRRAASAGPPEGRPTLTGGDASAEQSPLRGGVGRRAWRAFLPILRRVVPGQKFQVVAARE